MTLRLEPPLLTAAGLEFPTACTLVAWLCRVPNPIMAEWVLLGRSQGSPALAA